LDILLKEKDSRLAEAASHSERLQAGVIFYLTVVVVGIITAAWRKDAPDWREVRNKPATTFLVLLFLLANVNMAAQAMALSLDAMANVKFVHVYLNPQIATVAGWPLEVTPWSGNRPEKLHDALFWDQWWADQKQLFTAVRDEASGAWIAIVAITSLISLALFDPRGLPKPFAWIAHVGLVGVTAFAGWIAHAIFLYRYLGAHFRDRNVGAPAFHWQTALATTMLIVLGWLVMLAARRDTDASNRESGVKLIV
jgi:hypothetical protein